MSGRRLASYLAEYPGRGERVYRRLQRISGISSAKVRMRDPAKILACEGEMRRLRDLHRRDVLGLLPPTRDGEADLE
jgi:hypothetical protein